MSATQPDSVLIPETMLCDWPAWLTGREYKVAMHLALWAFRNNLGWESAWATVLEVSAGTGLKKRAAKKALAGLRDCRVVEAQADLLRDQDHPVYRLAYVPGDAEP